MLETELAKISQTLQETLFPKKFAVELTAHCNYACSMCHHPNMKRPYHQVARIALASTARAKLAGLLLEWADHDARPAASDVRFQLRMTHEEIGELVGSSRETIARILSDFRRRGLIQIEGTSITIPDRGRLEKLLS